MESRKVQKSQSWYEVAAEYFEENKTFTLSKFIPDELVLDNILPRLPAKSLHRFKSVCKYWLSYISSPEFAKTHFEFSKSSPRILLDDLDENRMYMISHDENNNSVTELCTLNCEHVDSHAPLDELDNDVGSDTIVGCCNGLVCLSLKDDDFALWNPATHQFQRIPLCESALKFINAEHPYYDQRSEFCYASSIDDWKILTVYHEVCDLSTANFFLFSMRAGAWKRLSHLDGDFYGRIVAQYSCNSVSVDGVLYVVYTDDNYEYDDGCEDKLFGFDVVDENISQVPGTNWLTKYEYVCHASKIKGCLSLACIKEDQFCDVWMLKQHGVADSWQKLFSCKNFFKHALGFTDNGKLLVDHMEQLILLDPTQEVADDDFDWNINDDLSIITRMFHYVESLMGIQIGQ